MARVVLISEQMLGVRFVCFEGRVYCSLTVLPELGDIRAVDLRRCRGLCMIALGIQGSGPVVMQPSLWSFEKLESFKLQTRTPARRHTAPV